VGGSIRERLTSTQKAIRPAAAPMNTFTAYCGRVDLNVCKRAPENGDGINWKLEASLKWDEAAQAWFCPADRTAIDR
jgi:hypothetical protein